MSDNLTSCENPIVPEPGIYHNVPYDEYEQWNAFRKSMIKSTLKSGKHLESFINNKKTSPSLSLAALLTAWF